MGRTFPVAMALLGAMALAQFGAVLWRAFHPAPLAPAPALAEAAKVQPTLSAPAPTPVSAVPPKTVQDQILAEDEKRLLRSLPQTPTQTAAEEERRLLATIPKPTPVPARREIATAESRVNELMDLARTLRDRGDTSTALTRLREAQAISARNPKIISEMAITYEKMGLPEKALEQWRRIYEFGEVAGIYYAAAEAKLRAYEMPPVSPAMAAPELAPAGSFGSLQPDANANINAAAGSPVLSLGRIGTTDDTGNSQPLRRLKLRIPILARPGAPVNVRDVVIQVYFYDQLKDGSVVETNANVSSSWLHRPGSDGVTVDWSTPEPEVLEVEYSQPEPDPANPRTRERRNYFGYGVRVYYKNELNASVAEPVKLLQQFPPPVTLQTSDLPQ